MKILIEKTKKTPYVYFDNGIIELKGRSILEDSTGFYEPLLSWLQNYIINPPKFTLVKFEVEYSNSNSNKFLYQILALLEKCYLNSHDMKVEWYYENDDDSIKDLGYDFQALTKLPFHLVEIKSR